MDLRGGEGDFQEKGRCLGCWKTNIYRKERFGLEKGYGYGTYQAWIIRVVSQMRYLAGG